MNNSDGDRIRAEVRDSYGRVAQGDCNGGGCCAPVSIDSSRLGYSLDELAAIPAGADLGLGCGNPGAIAALKPGETVLDLGSGAGVDCFLAARQVGDGGRAIGVDMTPEMLAKARANARVAGLSNVEFRLGEIEALPVADASVDVVISNCVINLSPDKGRVLREAFRVLRPGGRLAISDVVAIAELPEAMRGDLAMHSGCVSGAASVVALEQLLTAAGFAGVRIAPKDGSRAFIREWFPGSRVEDYVCSAIVEAVKPVTSASAAG